jgi:hypothetical protein
MVGLGRPGSTTLRFYVVISLSLHKLALPLAFPRPGRKRAC